MEKKHGDLKSMLNKNDGRLEKIENSLNNLTIIREIEKDERDRLNSENVIMFK